MPPERTTHSFVAAAAMNLPLSSHGPLHPPSLERGKACLVCRNRKVKCDGVKPACGACRKSAIAHGEDPDRILCNFDEEERGEKRKRGSGIGKVAALEAKIAELERLIDQQQPSPPTSFTGPPTASTSDFIDPLASFSADFDLFASQGRSSFDALLHVTGQQAPHYDQSRPGSGPGQPSTGVFFAGPADPAFSSTANAYRTSHPSPPLTPPDALLEIFYPGWPHDLPSPVLVMRLVDVYFSKTHAASGMLERGKFLASMALPPTHSGFPHTALLHAMLETASRMVGPTFFAQEDKYWGSADQPEQNVADYHSTRAKIAVEGAIVQGRNMFQVMQAVVLICIGSFMSARFVDIWIYCGLAMRFATPLGLNHIRAVQNYDDGSSGDRPPHMKANLLPPTGDEAELYERAATFWLAYVCDRFASASTGWAMALDDRDITSLLPSPGTSYSSGDLESSPLSPHNPNFLMSHPPHLVSCLQLYLKSVILLGRVISFMQRSPSPVGMGVNYPDPRRNPNAQTRPVDLRTSSEFKRLDADAVTFRLSIPREFQNTAAHTYSDVRMVLVFCVPHAATILLHEPFCTMQEADVSLARCLLSAKAILESIYSLWSTSFDISLLPPWCTFCWACSGRTLVRELAIKQGKGATTGYEQLKTDVQTVIAAMRSHRSALGDSTATALQGLLDNPERCLPHMNISGAGLGFGDNAEGCAISNAARAQATSSSTSPNDGSGSTSTPEGLSGASSGPSPTEVDYAALFSQSQDGAAASPAESDRFRELLGMVSGYLWGGMAFMPVPWAFSTAAALALVALSAGPGHMIVERLTNPANVAPAAASALLGTSGATLLLVVLFLAVTSAASAELVAVSSIVVYDIYKPYFNPHASEQTIVRVTHFAVCGYGVVMAILGIVFFKIGISLGWLYGLTGVMFSCAVAPVGFAIRTDSGNKWGCVSASIIGFVCSILAWVITAKEYYGIVDVTSTGGSYPQLAGNAAGIIISTTICSVTSYIWPANYDFDDLRRMNFAPGDVTETAPSQRNKASDLDGKGDGEKDLGAVADVIPVNNINDATEEELYRDFKFSCYSTIGSFFLLCVVVPAFAAIPAVWSKASFTAWIVIAFIYTFFAAFVVVLWPVWEARGILAAVSRGIVNDVLGRGLLKV